MSEFCNHLSRHLFYGISVVSVMRTCLISCAEAMTRKIIHYWAFWSNLFVVCGISWNKKIRVILRLGENLVKKCYDLKKKKNCLLFMELKKLKICSRSKSVILISIQIKTTPNDFSEIGRALASSGGHQQEIGFSASV